MSRASEWRARHLSAWIRHAQAHAFNEAKYNEFVQRALVGDVYSVLDEIERALYYLLPLGDQDSLQHCERLCPKERGWGTPIAEGTGRPTNFAGGLGRGAGLLIALHGSSDQLVSTRCIRMLNAIYDGHTWQVYCSTLSRSVCSYSSLPPFPKCDLAHGDAGSRSRRTLLWIFFVATIARCAVPAGRQDGTRLPLDYARLPTHHRGRRPPPAP